MPIPKFIATLGIFLVIFFTWQFYVYFKYMKHDNVKIDTKNKIITIRKTNINFSDIKWISVVDNLEQPKFYEKLLSKYAYNKKISNIDFYMQDNTVINCTCNTNRQVYEILTKLKPYININANIESYKPKLNMMPIYCIIAGLCYLIIASIICTIPH